MLVDSNPKILLDAFRDFEKKRKDDPQRVKDLRLGQDFVNTFFRGYLWPDLFYADDVKAKKIINQYVDFSFARGQ